MVIWDCKENKVIADGNELKGVDLGIVVTKEGAEALGKMISDIFIDNICTLDKYRNEVSEEELEDARTELASPYKFLRGIIKFEEDVSDEAINEMFPIVLSVKDLMANVVSKVIEGIQEVKAESLAKQEEPEALPEEE